MGIRLWRGIVVLGLLALTSCQNKQLKPIGLVRYVENLKNGMRKKVIIGAWEYDVQYKPVTYAICQEQRKETITKTELKNGKQAKEGYLIFSMKIKNTQYENMSMLKLISKDYTEYTKLFTYMSTEAKNDFELVYKNDKLTPTIYQYEPNFDITPYDVILVGFSIQPEKYATEDFTLIYNDNVLQNGILKCLFTKIDLQNLPSLQTLN